MTERTFLVLHGWENHRPPGHWQHWLADELLAAGNQVLYPQLPEPDFPILPEWERELRQGLAALRGEERVLICHSLAVFLLWNAAPTLGELQPDRVLLVAPPAPDVLRQYDAVAAFVPPAMERTPLTDGLRRRVRLVASDNDPYCPDGAQSEFAERFDLDADIVPGAGHLDLPAGYGTWPAVLDWCLDPTTRITGRT